MSFEYRNTCPLINDAITCIKEALYDKFSECFSSKTAAHLAPNIYDWIEEHIEDVRETNIKMREAAEEQIEAVEEENENLKERIKELESRIIDLE